MVPTLVINFIFFEIFVYEKNPASHYKSGLYVIKTNKVQLVYCDMRLECGSHKGGWMRIADLDTRRDNCPLKISTTILYVQEAQLVAATLHTSQLMAKVLVEYVRVTKREAWMGFTHMAMLHLVIKVIGLSKDYNYNRSGMPWFFQQLPVKESAPSIKVRICRDQGFYDEGVALEQL